MMFPKPKLNNFMLYSTKKSLFVYECAVILHIKLMFQFQSDHLLSSTIIYYPISLIMRHLKNKHKDQTYLIISDYKLKIYQCAMLRR